MFGSIPRPGEKGSGLTIVVGVDGSRESIAALRFAIGEARLRAEPVKAVIAWHIPPASHGTGFAPASVDPEELKGVASDVLSKAVGAANERETVRIETVVREGDAAQVLIDESQDATQLVVGCRSLNFVGRLLHHSVSGYCSRQAHCPVTVVHDG